ECKSDWGQRFAQIFRHRRRNFDESALHLWQEPARQRARRTMMHKFFVAFIPIFVAIDAIGLVAVFMGLAGDTPREQRQRGVFFAFFPALCFLFGFIFFGKIFFPAFGFPVGVFRGGGGLFLLGWAGGELFNAAPASREATDDFGVVPLGMPLIAGPALLT